MLKLHPRVYFIFLLATCYVLAGYLGLSLPVYGSQVTLFWPPTGIAVAALLQQGAGVWPGIALGAWVINLLSGGSLTLAAHITAGNTLGPLAAYALLKHYQISPRLEQRRDIFGFVLLGAVLPMLITSANGCWALWQAGLLPTEKILFVWNSWWWGDLLGVLLFAPPLLCPKPQLSKQPILTLIVQLRDSILAFFLLIASCVLIFFQPLTITLPPQTLILPILFIAWIAAIRGPWATSVANLSAALIAIIATAQGHHSFAPLNPLADLSWLWVFIASLSLIGLLVAALSANYRQAQAQLQQSEARLNEAQRIAKVGNWELDIPSGTLFWSEEVFRIFELESSQLIPSYDIFLQSIHPDDRETVNRAYLESLKNRSPYSIIHRLLMADGRIKYVHEQCQSFFNAQGNALRSIGTIQDITEYQRTKLELEESRNFMALVIEHIPTGLYWKDRDLNYLGGNRLFARDAGYKSIADVIGKRDAQMSWGSMAVQYEADDREIIESGLPKLNVEEAQLTSTGQPLVLKFSKVPLRNERDEVVGLLGIYEDITLQKQNQMELAQYREHLEAMVQQRTAELETAKTAAEAANRAKSVFLANMSHELRTPLNAVLGFAQLIVRNPQLPSSLLPEVQTILNSGEQLLSLISDVLEISSLEAEQLQLSPESFNLPELLAALADLIEPLAANKQLKFSLQQDGTLPDCIKCDFAKLKRIIYSLLINAVKFTHQGGITLFAKTDFDADGHTILHITVTDTGVGMSLQEQAHLFKPFFQTDYGASLGCGTGLGLFICQAYVKLLGGEILVNSTPGQGTAFEVRLPVTVVDVCESIMTYSKQILSLAPGQPSTRVLVVDDEAIHQYVLSELLKQVGFQVCVANNGQEAVELFQTWRPHFVYMDIRMPVMNGYDAARTIRATANGKDIPIIALTASAVNDPQEHFEMLNAGFDDLLKKPVTANQLLETIARYLNLQFEYGNKPDIPVSPTQQLDLSGLPDTICQRLNAAALALDTDATYAVINEFAETHPKLAQQLRLLVEEFQFALIEQATALR